MSNKNIFNTTAFSDRAFEKVCFDFAKDMGEAIGKGVKITPEAIEYWFEMKEPAFSTAEERKAVTDAVYAGIGLVALVSLI